MKAAVDAETFHCGVEGFTMADKEGPTRRPRFVQGGIRSEEGAL